VYASIHNPLHLTHGSLIGPYRILAPLGAGGMGEVYRARDDRLNRDLALKVLSGDLASSSEHIRRFQQEAHAASALNHPNIITIYDIGTLDESAYIAMELVDGQDLRSYQAGERLPFKQALRIAVKVADGLAAAHERGIVHRDLKPENVMISRDGFVKILDFGLAKLVRPITETQTTAPHTTPGAVFGTVSYMSPEQAAGRIVDFRSDQFSLGVILYEMLTGKMPFSEPTAAETLAAIIRRNPSPASSINDAVTPELERILERCLAKDPADRYASTRDLAHDLREIRDRISTTSEPRHRSDHPPARPSRRMAWIGGAAAGALLLAVGVIMGVRQMQPPQKPPQHRGPESVALLPFKNVSGTPEGQIFSDGVAEMIRSRLAENRTIRVVPSFDADPRANPAALAKQLNTSYVVTGTAQREGSQVHLSVSVINAATGEQVAGQTLNGTTADIFGLHNRAVDLILGGMNVRGDPHERSVPTALSNAADQSAYIEALGLLQNARDESSVDRAIATLTDLLRNARDSAIVNAQLARALLYKSQLSRRPGLIEQATLYAERAAELDDSVPEIHIRLGQLRREVGRYADAEREFRRALSLYGDSPDAYLGLAETYAGMGRGADAEEMYKKAIAMRPNHAGTYNSYAIFLLNAGRTGEAATNFRRFTELLPTPRGFNNLGAAYQALGKYDEARAAYEKSIALGPYSDAYANLGMLHFYMGNFREAARALEQAVALSPDSYLAWLALGDTYRWSPEMRGRSSGAYERAVSAAREAIDVNAHDAVAHASSANALAKLGRLPEASAESDRALKLDPTNQNVLYDAAVVAQLRGNGDAAVGWLQRAVGAGYSIADLQHDPEFRTARADPAFPRIVAEQK
jgi:serine/threonine protein kinase/tetratricopeptide (TPR) repeat protein